MAAPRRRRAGGRLGQLLPCVVVGLVAMAALRGADATCPTFAAWLRPENEVHPVICSSVPCDNIEGFATVSVAPDGSSITITIQVTALSFSSAIPTFLMAGIYGPARSHEEMPAGTKPLVEIAIPSVALSESTWTGVFRRTAADMPALLALMRTGQASPSARSSPRPTPVAFVV
ncbi:hypothetical protein T484DRAFT_2766749 [Baffinella frigidus]|nr:hypothetical protein T484DRAFT_2766749 [Cryptophyta sp. CCMP2293]